MKKCLIIFLLFAICVGCADRYKTEKELQACFYDALGEQSEKVKYHIKKYEDILIERGILKDKSKESYYATFEKLIRRDFFEEELSYGLLDSLNEIVPLNFADVNLNCLEKVKQTESYETSVTASIKNQLEEAVKNNVPNDAIMDVVITLYPSDYFQLELHKIQALLLIDRTTGKFKL